MLKCLSFSSFGWQSALFHKFLIQVDGFLCCPGRAEVILAKSKYDTFAGVLLEIFAALLSSHYLRNPAVTQYTLPFTPLGTKTRRFWCESFI